MLDCRQPFRGLSGFGKNSLIEKKINNNLVLFDNIVIDLKDFLLLSFN